MKLIIKNKYLLKITKIITVSILLITPLFAEVRFDLRFTDPENTGFKDPKNAWMIKAVQEGADLLGKCIEQNAFVTINVHSQSNNFADAESDYIEEIHSSQAKYITVAMDKILKGRSKFNGLWEGTIAFNTEMFRDYDTLKKTTVHELTHILGFNSLSFAPFNPKLGKHSIQPYFYDFDLLMVDKNNNPLVKENDYILNPNFDASLGSDLFACGTNIKKRNDGKCVKLYNPPTFASGASFTHLDIDTYPQNLLNYKNSPSKHPMWNKYEISIMEDLGYKIDFNNYCRIMEDLFPKALSLDFNLEDLEDKSYLVINKYAKDFPQECFPNNFSFVVTFDHKQMQFFVDDQLIHVVNSIVDLNKSNIHIMDNEYHIKYSIINDNILHLDFIKIIKDNRFREQDPKLDQEIKNLIEPALDL